VRDRKYLKKKQVIEKVIQQHGKFVDYSVILNEVDIGYDTLMKILSELRTEGRIK
jgi:hypothetical protein